MQRIHINLIYHYVYIVNYLRNGTLTKETTIRTLLHDKPKISGQRILVGILDEYAEILREIANRFVLSANAGSNGQLHISLHAGRRMEQIHGG